MIDHSVRAGELFLAGYNCSQSVVVAFCDVTGLSEAFAAKLSSSFGGGMGRMREVCGAVSGMLPVAGLLYGYSTPGDDAAKRSHYTLVQALAGQFREALGIPVGFDTDVNAAALGEATWGCTRDLRSSIYITIGTGVGVGVIINGRPYHGMMHPEGGHVLLTRHPDDPMAGSGCPFHDNCLEGLAAGPSLEKRWGVKGAELAGRPEVWEIEAYYIAQAIVDYMMVLSPERIILGGGVTPQECLLPLVRRQVEKLLGGYLRCPALEDLDSYIVPVSLNDNQGAMGAVKLAMEELERESR